MSKPNVRIFGKVISTCVFTACMALLTYFALQGVRYNRLVRGGGEQYTLTYARVRNGALVDETVTLVACRLCGSQRIGRGPNTGKHLDVIPFKRPSLHIGVYEGLESVSVPINEPTVILITHDCERRVR